MKKKRIIIGSIFLLLGGYALYTLKKEKKTNSDLNTYENKNYILLHEVKAKPKGENSYPDRNYIDLSQYQKTK